MKIIKNIVFCLATVLVLVAIVFIALPLLGGLEYRTIVSGSMEPEIPVGSLVIIEKVKDEEIKIGDVVTFYLSGETTVTHKVVGYDLSKDALITHGVANDEGTNEYTPFDSVLGRVVFTVPWIGRLFLFVSTTRGKIIAATIIVVLYILSVFFETLGSHDEDEEEPAPARGKPPEAGAKPTTEIQKFGSWLDDLP